MPFDAEQTAELERRFAAGEKPIAVSVAMGLPVADVIAAWRKSTSRQNRSA